MSKICKKCDTLITFGDNNYCELCANILVADLEAKLAESKEQLFAMNEKSNKIKKESYYLKQQLAEKEKEITDFELEVGDLRLQNRNLKEQFKFAVQSKNQDKISFCIEKLEELADCSNYINSQLDFECGFYVSEKCIREQIKQLKEMK